MALYREAYKVAFGDYPAVVSIAAITKQAHPRMKVLVFDTADRFAHEIEKIEERVAEVAAWREKAIAGDFDGIPRCRECDYCAETGEAGIEAAESLVW